MQVKRTLVFLTIFMLAGGGVQAQSPEQILRQTEGAERAQRQADQLYREQMQEDMDRLQRPSRSNGMPRIAAPEATDAKPVQSDTKCHLVRELEIHGAVSLPDHEVRAFENQFESACITAAHIESIMARVTAAYLRDGMVMARVYLPSQDLSSGKLVLEVREGLIEKYVVKDGDKNSVRPGLVMPLKEGDVLNLRDLEQGMDQLGKLSSNNARLDVQPGSEAGTSIVVIENSPTLPVSGSISYDNHGSASSGKNSVGVGLTTENALGLNEYIGLTHRKNLPNGPGDRRRTESSSLTSVFYWGYSTFTGNLATSRYANPTRLTSGREYILTGSTMLASARYSRLLYRSAGTQLSFGAGLDVKTSKNYFEYELLTLGSRRLSVLDASLTAQTNLLGGSMQVTVGVARGVQWFNALKDDPDLVDAAPRAQFRKSTLTGSFQRPFQVLGINGALSVQYSNQVAHTPLYGSDQMTIGGLGSVRGFSKNSWSGDSGYYVRSDLSVFHRLDLLGSNASLRTYVGYDFGRVRSKFEEQRWGVMSGMALGASLQLGRANIEVVRTRPIKFPVVSVEEAPQTWVRLSVLI